MVVIEPFEVEKWMDAYETTPGVVNIAETCSASISIDELVGLSVDKTTSPFNTSIPLAYGPIRGSASLRSNIAAIHSKGEGFVQADDVLVTQGAIGANFLVLYTLVGPGDHVVCIHPTYNQLSAVPKSLGADVSLWNLKAENGFVPDVSELGGLVKRNTKMIIINNPNNPTGATIPKSVLGDIVEFARSRDIIVFSDEVYWPLFHSLPEGSDTPPSVLSFDYDKSISTGSMSKTYALAGLRLGWIASRDKAIIEALASARDYTTISVSLLNDQVASYALSAPVLPALMERNLSLCRRNLERLSEFVERNSAHCNWVKPTAGTTAFVQFRKGGKPVNDVDFCIDLLNATKVMFVPGNKCFAKSDEFPGYVRIGYACQTDVLERGLKLLEEYVKEKLASA